MAHVVLLGDSIFDNRSYVLDGHSVADHLKIKLPETDRVTLLAQDGSKLKDMQKQLDRLPSDATHVFVSIGGNDVLALRPKINEKNPPKSNDLVLPSFLPFITTFDREYSFLISSIISKNCTPVLCTIYDNIPGLTKHESLALTLINDRIVQFAIQTGNDFLDLRFVCTEKEDYSQTSPIEPSEIGGLKIAHHISRIVTKRDKALSSCYGDRDFVNEYLDKLAFTQPILEAGYKEEAEWRAEGYYLGADLRLHKEEDLS